MRLRVSAIAAAAQPVRDVQEWRARLRTQLRAARDAGARLAVLPEYVTAPLLALHSDWDHWTKPWQDAITSLSRELSIAVLGGTHLTRVEGHWRNRALLVDSDGGVTTQDKLHPTPWERGWGVTAHDTIRITEIDGVRVACLVCYDIEFPEAARAACRAGAELLLVPSWTDDRAGFHRVRLCAQARCIENSVFAIHAPLVGHLDQPDGFEQGIGEAAILTPCDVPFAHDGCAARGGWNHPETIVAELDIDALRAIRSSGTVTPATDARMLASYRTIAAKT